MQGKITENFTTHGQKNAGGFLFGHPTKYPLQVVASALPIFFYPKGGRASALHAEGRGFETLTVHKPLKTSIPEYQGLGFSTFTPPPPSMPTQGEGLFISN